MNGRSQAVTGRMAGAGTNVAHTVIFDRDLDWQRHGACVGDQPDQFFPEGRPANAPRLLCKQHCPVREQCLAWALAHDEEGIWGGLTEPERRRLKRKNRSEAK